MFTLRDFQFHDTQRLVEILNDSDVTAFLSTKIPQPYTKADALWWVEEGSKSGLIKAITVNDELAGCIGVNRGEFEYERSAEIGYWLAQSHWRKGIMLGAIEQLVEDVFTNTNIVRIFANVFSPNDASKQLLLKAGFQQEGVLKHAIFKQGAIYDCHLFSKLKNS